MAFNINDFTANLNKKGTAKASHFDINISRTFKPDSAVEREIGMRCLSTELPGVSIDTIEHGYAGPAHKIATGAGYADQNLNILLSSDYQERKYFEEWKSSIVGDHSVASPSRRMFNLSFFADYIGTVTINTYTETGDRAYSIKLYEAFPVSIGSVQLDWSTGDQLIVLPVSMTYRYYTQEK